MPLDFDGLDGVLEVSEDDAPPAVAPEVLVPSRPPSRSRRWVAPASAAFALGLLASALAVTHSPPDVVVAVFAPPDAAPPRRVAPSSPAVAPAALPPPPAAPPEVELPFRFRPNGRTPEPLDDRAAVEVDEALAALLSRCGPWGVLELTGHTDALGEPSANRLLGLDRAERVRSLIGRNRRFPVVVVRSAGSSRPVVSNATPEGRRANRRVTAACITPSAAKEDPNERIPE